MSLSADESEAEAVDDLRRKWEEDVDGSSVLLLSFLELEKGREVERRRNVDAMVGDLVVLVIGLRAVSSKICSLQIEVFCRTRFIEIDRKEFSNISRLCLVSKKSQCMVCLMSGRSGC